jgi:hypothetical protein
MAVDPNANDWIEHAATLMPVVLKLSAIVVGSLFAVIVWFFKKNSAAAEKQLNDLVTEIDELEHRIDMQERNFERLLTQHQMTHGAGTGNPVVDAAQAGYALYRLQPGNDRRRRPQP